MIKGRPEFDDPAQYAGIHETIRVYEKPTERVVAMCFDCMENPKMQPKNKDDFPQRCESCDFKHTRRLKIASAAKGGY